MTALPSESAAPPAVPPTAPSRSFYLWALALCALAVAAPVVAGFDGKRVLQLLILALPALLVLLYPAPSARGRRLQALAAGAYALLFITDGTTRAYLLELYDAAPNSALVLAAIANANAGETLEYARTQAWPLARVASEALACVITLGLGLRLWCRHARPQPQRNRLRLAVLLLCLLLVAVAVASKPWRRHHPLPFWVEWWQDVGRLRSHWALLNDQRERLLAIARARAPRLAADAPSTAVLVITDSVNRDNLALYGYPRATTPALTAALADADGRLGVFRHAWSLDAATIPALRRLFYFGAPDTADPQHLLALARAAGYRITWIGNHADLAVEQEHAQLADTVRMLNQTPGRSTSQPDGVILDSLRTALAEPGKRKLIVLHLLGAHPHYRLRYPEGTPRFGDDANNGDAVERELRAADRPFWLRALRNDYDTALRYHDGIVAETLRLTRAASPDAVWLYLSDHGQEVGHSRNQAGHSPNTAAGYRIPLLAWRPVPFSAAQLAEPVRADWLGYSLGSLLGLAWPGYDAQRDALSPDYRWQAPPHPVIKDASDFTR